MLFTIAGCDRRKHWSSQYRSVSLAAPFCTDWFTG
jgi:hypothetical protein